jgi:hypothetical protein
MRKILILILLISSLSGSYSFSQNIDIVKGIPGKGIVFNNDTIFLNTTSITQLCKILKIKDTIKLDNIPITWWDGFDPKTGKEVSGSYYEKDIIYKSIKFEYKDENDGYKLDWITLKENDSLKISIENKLEIGEIDPKFNELYPIMKIYDFVSEDKLRYNLYSYGISFHLEKDLKNERKLVEISIHFTLEK